MPSAIAQTNIFPGAAIALSKDNASLASPSLLATHIVVTGAIARGIVSIVSIGSVTLSDWTLATGSSALTTGATYYVGVGGKLVKTSGQPVGIATSPTTLSVTIQNQQSASQTQQSIAALTSQVNALAAQLASIKIPNIYAGSFAIGNGVNSGSVTGLSTSFTPTKAICTIRAPSGSIVMFAEAVDATISTAGFDFVTSAVTDSANYVLDYILTT